MAERLLLRCRDIPDLRRLDVYRAHGGYEAARNALLHHAPEALVEMVKASNLRGRGGRLRRHEVGLPSEAERKARHLCVNADERPGTFKDRRLADDPHRVEGI